MMKKTVLRVFCFAFMIVMLLSLASCKSKEDLEYEAAERAYNSAKGVADDAARRYNDLERGLGRYNDALDRYESLK